jgi:hypothetical protein
MVGPRPSLEPDSPSLQGIKERLYIVRHSKNLNKLHGFVQTCIYECTVYISREVCTAQVLYVQHIHSPDITISNP